MTKKEFTISILLCAVILALLGWAGADDAHEATICEMQNNGTYWQMKAEHPDWDEATMIRNYQPLNTDDHD